MFDSHASRCTCSQAGLRHHSRTVSLFRVRVSPLARGQMPTCKGRSGQLMDASSCQPNMLRANDHAAAERARLTPRPSTNCQKVFQIYDVALVKVEIDIDHDLNGDRMSLIHCRPKLVLPHRFYCFFVQTHAEAAGNVNVLRISFCIDNQLK